MGEKKIIDLKLAGMHCATCSVTIEEAIAGIGKGTTAKANFGTDSARVEYDPENVSLQEIEKVVKDAGYEVINRISQAFVQANKQDRFTSPNFFERADGN